MSESSIAQSSWAVTCQSSGTRVSFRHMHLDSISSIRDAIKVKPPRNKIIDRGASRLALDISKNFLEKVDTNELLEILETALHVSGCPVTSDLQELALGSNSLTALPMIRSPLPSLEVLSLCHNHISTVEDCPDLKEMLPNLRELDLRNNQIGDCYPLLTTLHNHPVLRSLSFSCNPIASIRISDFPHLPVLEVLGFFGTKIEAFFEDDDFGSSDASAFLACIAPRLPSLRHLYVKGTPLFDLYNEKTLRAAVQRCFPSLETLDGMRV